MTWSEIATTWVERGYAVIPIHKGEKKPYILWKQYQTRKPTMEEVMQWWTQWPDAWVAVIGGHDGLICLDVDDKELADKLIPAFKEYGRIDRSRKSGKMHLFMKEEETSKSGPLISGKCDLKGSKAYFLVAPSNNYERHNETEDWMPVPVYSAREYMETYLRGLGYEVEEKKEQITIQDKYDGEGRNNMIISIAGMLRHYGAGEELIDTVTRTINKKHCLPPLDEEEFNRTVKSAVKYKPNKSLTDNYYVRRLFERR